MVSYMACMDAILAQWPRSSVDQSSCLLSSWSQVRLLPGPPDADSLGGGSYSASLIATSICHFDLRDSMLGSVR